MNIHENHGALLMELGYTEPEARFLYVVATHSGYFILRQFLNFTGARRGKRSDLFARKVLNNGHTSVRDYLGYGSIYHLFSRTLYGQIEKVNLRNRRKHSFEYIRTRLVLLDFILANPEVEYLETEQDKGNLLVPRRSLEEQLLAGLQAKVLHPDVTEYTLRGFEEALAKAANSRRSDVSDLERCKATIEQQTQTARRLSRTDSHLGSSLPSWAN